MYFEIHHQHQNEVEEKVEESKEEMKWNSYQSHTEDWTKEITENKSILKIPV